ncbi:MAG: hypothetical protein ACJ0F4_00975 [Gammaproteobacteria bacterium]
MRQLILTLTVFFLFSCTTSKEGKARVNIENNVIPVMVYDKETIVCRKIEITGSRLKKKVCATKREWEQMERESKDYLKSVIDRSGSLPGSSGNPSPKGN